MDIAVEFPFSSVYKLTPHGLSLYTQEYMQKFLSEKADDKDKKEDSKEDSKEDKEKFAKKSKINMNPKDEMSEY